MNKKTFLNLSLIVLVLFTLAAAIFAFGVLYNTEEAKAENYLPATAIKLGNETLANDKTYFDGVNA